MFVGLFIFKQMFWGHCGTPCAPRTRSSGPRGRKAPGRDPGLPHRWSPAATSWWPSPASPGGDPAVLPGCGGVPGQPPCLSFLSQQRVPGKSAVPRLQRRHHLPAVVLLCPCSRSPVGSSASSVRPQPSLSLGKKGLLFCYDGPVSLFRHIFRTNRRRITRTAGYSIPQSRIRWRSPGCHAAFLRALKQSTGKCVREVTAFPQVPVYTPRGCRSGAEPRTCPASRTPLLGAGFILIPSSTNRVGVSRGYQPVVRANVAVRAKIKCKQKLCDTS